MTNKHPSHAKQKRAVERLQQGMAFHQQGDLDKAEQRYEQVLKDDPDQPDALHLSGLIAHQKGNHDRAIHLIEKAIRIKPDFADFFSNLGIVHASKNDYQNACRAYEQALKLNPEHAQALNNCGISLVKINQFDRAIEVYQRLIALNPEDDKALCNLGDALRLEGRFEEAIECFDKTIQINPDYADAWSNLGGILCLQHRYSEAEKYLLKAIELDPEYASIWNNLGVTYKEQGKYSQAKEAFEKALSINSGYAEAHNNLGTTLERLGLSVSARKHFENSIQIKPDYADPYNNLGNLLRDSGNPEQAQPLFEKALELNPNFAEAHFNLGITHLVQGNFNKGWPEFEWRFGADKLRSRYETRFTNPRWNGEPFKGKHLLIHDEQGFGDAIQFARYLTMVKSLGGSVTLEAKPSLIPLIRSIDAVDEFIVTNLDQPIPCKYDLYIPLMSLPLVFNTGINSIPADTPYLKSTSTVSEEVTRLLETDRLRIGIVWAGNPEHNNDRNRSCPIEQFLKLSPLPGIKLFSLQMGIAKQQLDPHKNTITDLTTNIESFNDTAAIIERLDLVISVDTSIVHLAGALGKPVWTLLPTNPDWRWMLDREDSPWYPTMRLFRQKEQGNWDELFERVCTSISTL